MGGKAASKGNPLFAVPNLSNLTEEERNNPINLEEIEADKQYALVEEYLDGRRTKKREEKAEGKAA